MTTTNTTNNPVNSEMWNGFNDVGKHANNTVIGTNITMTSGEDKLNVTVDQRGTINLKLNDDDPVTFEGDTFYFDDISITNWLLNAFSCMEYLYECECEKPEDIFKEIQSSVDFEINEETVNYYTRVTCFLMKVFDTDYEKALRFYKATYNLHKHQIAYLKEMLNRCKNWETSDERNFPPYGDCIAYPFNISIVGDAENLAV